MRIIVKILLLAFFFTSQVAIAQDADFYRQQGDLCYDQISKNREAIKCAKENYELYMQMYKDNPSRILSYIKERYEELTKKKNEPNQKKITEQQIKTDNIQEIKSISGRVISEEGEPTDSVLITISDLNERTTTSNNGFFYFDIKGKGLTTKQNIKVDTFKVGYKFQEINRTLNGSGVIADAIKLEKDAGQSFYIQVNDAESNKGIDNVEIYCNIGGCEKAGSIPGFYKVAVTQKGIHRFIINVSKQGYINHTENDIFLDKILLDGVYKINLNKPITPVDGFNPKSLVPSWMQFERGDKCKAHLFLWSEVALIPSAIISWSQYCKYKELSKSPSRNQNTYETNRDICLGLGIVTTALAVGSYAWNIIDGNTNKDKKIVFMPYAAPNEYGAALSLKF